jgi:hypothetical protein
VNPHDTTADIAIELWSILHALKADEMDPEKAEQMISALDSLREMNKLESTEVPSSPATETSCTSKGES